MSKYDHLIRLVRLARQLEMAGHYNAAKLFWAAAFSEEVHASNEGLHVAHRELLREMGEAVQSLSGKASPELLAAMERAQTAIQEERAISAAEVPPVHICRVCGAVALGPAPAQCPECGGFELVFREFPPVHYLEPLPPMQVLDALAAVPDAVQRLIGGLSDDQMRQPPRAGEWSIAEVLDHLLEAQQLVSGRVEKMLTEENPPLKAVNVPRTGESLSPRETLDRFRESRNALVDRLRGIGPLDWWRSGEHEEFGPVTVVQQASYFAKHDHAHLTQIHATCQAVVRNFPRS